MRAGSGLLGAAAAACSDAGQYWEQMECSVRAVVLRMSGICAS